LTHRCDLPPAPIAVTALVDLLHRTLSAKAVEFAQHQHPSRQTAIDSKRSFRGAEAVSNG